MSRVDPSDLEMAAVHAQGWPIVPTMLTQDPPLQQKYRRLVTKAFSLARLEGMGDYITLIWDELIDRFVERGSWDFFQDFAVRLPISSSAVRARHQRSLLDRAGIAK